MKKERGQYLLLHFRYFRTLAFVAGAFILYGLLSLCKRENEMQGSCKTGVIEYFTEQEV